MTTRAPLLVCAILLAFAINEGWCSGVLTIRLTGFKNPYGRTYDGACCDPSPRDHGTTCNDQCDYVMRLIVTGLGRANDHVFLFHRPLKYDSNNIVFEQGDSNLLLTVLFDQWPTDGQVKMNAFFYDYDDFDHTTTLVDWFETDLQHSQRSISDIENLWGHFQEQTVTGNRKTDKTVLTFEWSALSRENGEYTLAPFEEKKKIPNADPTAIIHLSTPQRATHLLREAWSNGHDNMYGDMEKDGIFYPDYYDDQNLISSPERLWLVNPGHHQSDLKLNNLLQPSSAKNKERVNNVPTKDLTLQRQKKLRKTWPMTHSSQNENNLSPEIPYELSSRVTNSPRAPSKYRLNNMIDPDAMQDPGMMLKSAFYDSRRQGHKLDNSHNKIFSDYNDEPYSFNSNKFRSPYLNQENTKQRKNKLQKALPSRRNGKDNYGSERSSNHIAPGDEPSHWNPPEEPSDLNTPPKAKFHDSAVSMKGTKRRYSGNRKRLTTSHIDPFVLTTERQIRNNDKASKTEYYFVTSVRNDTNTPSNNMPSGPQAMNEVNQHFDDRHRDTDNKLQASQDKTDSTRKSLSNMEGRNHHSQQKTPKTNTHIVPPQSKGQTSNDESDTNNSYKTTQIVLPNSAAAAGPKNRLKTLKGGIRRADSEKQWPKSKQSHAGEVYEKDAHNMTNNRKDHGISETPERWWSIFTVSPNQTLVPTWKINGNTKSFLQTDHVSAAPTASTASPESVMLRAKVDNNKHQNIEDRYPESLDKTPKLVPYGKTSLSVRSEDKVKHSSLERRTMSDDDHVQEKILPPTTERWSSTFPESHTKHWKSQWKDREVLKNAKIFGTENDMTSHISLNTDKQSSKTQPQSTKIIGNRAETSVGLSEDDKYKPEDSFEKAHQGMVLLRSSAEQIKQNSLNGNDHENLDTVTAGAKTVKSWGNGKNNEYDKAVGSHHVTTNYLEDNAKDIGEESENIISSVEVPLYHLELEDDMDYTNFEDTSDPTTVPQTTVKQKKTWYGAEKRLRNVEMLRHSIKKLKSVKYQTHEPVEWVVTSQPIIKKALFNKGQALMREPESTTGPYKIPLNNDIWLDSTNINLKGIASKDDYSRNRFAHTAHGQIISDEKNMYETPKPNLSNKPSSNPRHSTRKKPQEAVARHQENRSTFNPVKTESKNYNSEDTGFSTAAATTEYQNTAFNEPLTIKVNGLNPKKMDTEVIPTTMTTDIPLIDVFNIELNKDNFNTRHQGERTDDRATNYITKLTTRRQDVDNTFSTHVLESESITDNNMPVHKQTSPPGNHHKIDKEVHRESFPTFNGHEGNSAKNVDSDPFLSIKPNWKNLDEKTYHDPIPTFKERESNHKRLSNKPTAKIDTGNLSQYDGSPKQRRFRPVNGHKDSPLSKKQEDSRYQETKDATLKDDNQEWKKRQNGLPVSLSGTNKPSVATPTTDHPMSSRPPIIINNNKGTEKLDGDSIALPKHNRRDKVSSTFAGNQEHDSKMNVQPKDQESKTLSQQTDDTPLPDENTPQHISHTGMEQTNNEKTLEELVHDDLTQLGSDFYITFSYPGMHHQSTFGPAAVANSKTVMPYVEEAVDSVQETQFRDYDQTVAHGRTKISFSPETLTGADTKLYDGTDKDVSKLISQQSNTRSKPTEKLPYYSQVRDRTKVKNWSNFDTSNTLTKKVSHGTQDIDKTKNMRQNDNDEFGDQFHDNNENPQPIVKKKVTDESEVLNADKNLNVNYLKPKSHYQQSTMKPQHIKPFNKAADNLKARMDTNLDEKSTSKKSQDSKPSKRIKDERKTNVKYSEDRSSTSKTKGTEQNNIQNIKSGKGMSDKMLESENVRKTTKTENTTKKTTEVTSAATLPIEGSRVTELYALKETQDTLSKMNPLAEEFENSKLLTPRKNKVQTEAKEPLLDKYIVQTQTPLSQDKDEHVAGGTLLNGDIIRAPKTSTEDKNGAVAKEPLSYEKNRSMQTVASITEDKSKAVTIDFQQYKDTTKIFTASVEEKNEAVVKEDVANKYKSHTLATPTEGKDEAAVKDFPQSKGTTKSVAVSIQGKYQDVARHILPSGNKPQTTATPTEGKDEDVAKGSLPDRDIRTANVESGEEPLSDADKRQKPTVSNDNIYENTLVKETELSPANVSPVTKSQLQSEQNDIFQDPFDLMTLFRADQVLLDAIKELEKRKRSNTELTTSSFSTSAIVVNENEKPVMLAVNNTANASVTTMPVNALANVTSNEAKDMSTSSTMTESTVAKAKDNPYETTKPSEDVSEERRQTDFTAGFADEFTHADAITTSADHHQNKMQPSNKTNTTPIKLVPSLSVKDLTITDKVTKEIKETTASTATTFTVPISTENEITTADIVDAASTDEHTTVLIESVLKPVQQDNLTTPGTTSHSALENVDSITLGELLIGIQSTTPVVTMETTATSIPSTQVDAYELTNKPEGTENKPVSTTTVKPAEITVRDIMENIHMSSKLINVDMLRELGMIRAEEKVTQTSHQNFENKMSAKSIILGPDFDRADTKISFLPLKERQEDETVYSIQTFLTPKHLMNPFTNTLPDAGFVLHTRAPDARFRENNYNNKNRNPSYQLPKPNLHRSKTGVRRHNLHRAINLDKLRTFIKSIRSGPTVNVPSRGLYTPEGYNNSDIFDVAQDAAELPSPVKRYGSPYYPSIKDVGTVFTRYWPAVLGISIGTIFLLTALVTSVLCRQRRLLVQRARWVDSPQHVSEPPTSEYASSSEASLTGELTRSSINLM